MALQPGHRLGGFEVVAPIGAGGMGEVYRARDTRLGRDVALKTLPESVAEDRDRVARFEQEARAASALNHPNIVSIFEIGRDGGVTFVAMELVDGKTLRELMVAGALPVKRMLNVGAQVAEGLAKAHAAGIVHRDLKPENVMVSKDGFVKILDFGLAKLIEPDAASHGLSAMPTLGQPETHPGTVLGTVGYMSPEQASGEPLDYRSDQFSLGTILYEMATGKKAFQRRTAAETMSAIIREEPEPAGKLRPDLPPPVRWVIERCLAKDRDERYASTRDLARDLAGLRDHITEASSGSGALAASLARPRRRWAVPAGALLLAAAAVLAGRWSVRDRGAAAPVFHQLSFGRVEGIGNARFTSDGKTVVYGVFGGAHHAGSQLMFTREGNPESKAFDFPGDILSISKTDELAVFQQGTGRFGVGALAVASLTGGKPRPLVADVTWAGADWDPAGTGLAVLRAGAEGPVRLEFPLNHPLLEGRLEGLRFSPDGSRLAVVSGDVGSSSIVVLDRDGKNRKEFPGWFAASGVPNWHPNGEIWFTARRKGDADSLWAATLSGGVRLVAHVPGTLELYDIAPDGRVLIGHHTQIRTIRGVSSSDLSEGELSWLDNSELSDMSPDGTTLLLTEVGAGAGEGPAFYTRTTDRAPATRISDGWGLALSADKKWVVANRRDEAGKWRLWLVPTGTGDPRPLVPADYDVSGAAFIAGTRIVFCTEGPDGKDRRLYTLDTSGGKPVPIPGSEDATISLWGSPVSPDGRRLLVSRRGALLVLPLAGGDAKPIPGLSVPGYRAPQWSADSGSVYNFTPTGRSLDVDLVNVETGARRPFKQIPVGSDDWRTFRLRMTPDGRVWAYRAEMMTSELYVVEGLR